MTEKRFEYVYLDELGVNAIKDNVTGKHTPLSNNIADKLNELNDENKELKVELHKIYKLATVNKVRDIVDEVYDDLLYETTDESDYARKKVLECLEKLDEFGDELE